MPLRHFIFRLNISTKLTSAVILRRMCNIRLEGSKFHLCHASFETPPLAAPQDDARAGGVNQYRKRSRFTHAAALCLWLIACLALTPATLAEVEKQPFTIDDYFKVKRVTELALSSDGEMIAYAVEHQSLEENKIIREVFIQSATPGSEPILIKKIQRARSLAWIPGTHELAYLLSDEDTAQVYSIKIKNGKVRQHTRGEDMVTMFRFAPDGKALAWVTQDQHGDKLPSLYNRLHNGDEGILIDSNNTVVYQFVNPDWGDHTTRSSHKLWLKQTGKNVIQAEIPKGIENFYWAPNGKSLSVTYVADDVPEEAFFNKYTSLGLFDIVTMNFETIARARTQAEGVSAKYFVGGEWSQSGTKLLIRRVVERDAWFNESGWAIFDRSQGEFDEESLDWREIEHSRSDEYIPADASRLYVNKTINAVHALYEITPKGLKRASILQDVGGTVTKLQFSDDHSEAAFVNESLNRPQEIYVWRKDQGSSQLTHLNEGIANRLLPKTREIVWKSKDGVNVHGWLMEPADRDSDGPAPLFTFVHGGPGVPMYDEFVSKYGNWTHPFELYTRCGIAVFMPNYRGTGSFGAEFGDPGSIAGEPVDDVISGIAYLVDQGVADPDRLAISGHSHGGWLAPLIMTRAKIFRAGSFAEGAGNMIVNYDLMPGWLNRRTHDLISGGSLYDKPQHYIDQSPELHFQGLNTAVLFEAGVKISAINMLGYPKAARYAGMPTEYFIYPKTGHGMTIPRLQKESATRNLDWFRFWLMGEEDPDPAKAAQYTRWRKMRDERCARKDLDRPSYCAVNDNAALAGEAAGQQ